MAEEEVLVIDGERGNEPVEGDNLVGRPGEHDVPDSEGDDTNDGDPSGDDGGAPTGGDADDVGGDSGGSVNGDDDGGGGDAGDDGDDGDGAGDGETQEEEEEEEEEEEGEVGGPPHSEGPFTNLPPNAASQAKMVAGSNALEARKKAELAERLGLGKVPQEAGGERMGVPCNGAVRGERFVLDLHPFRGTCLFLHANIYTVRLWRYKVSV